MVEQHLFKHEDAFPSITNEVKKRLQLESVLQTMHLRIEEVTSRVGHLEVVGNSNHVNVERVIVAMEILQGRQIHLKHLMRKFWQEVQQLFVAHSPGGCSKKKVGFDGPIASLELEMDELDDLFNSEVERCLQDFSVASPTPHMKSSENFSEESGSIEKLSLLLKELQEEHVVVADMLENVRQEKLEVIQTMHAFHLQKVRAVEEIKDAENRMSRQRSRRKAHSVEADQRILLQALPFSPCQIPDALGQNLLSMPTVGSSNHPMAAKYLSPGMNVQLAQAVQTSYSPGAACGPLSPVPPRAVLTDTQKLRVPPQIAVPYAMPRKSGTVVSSHLGGSAQIDQEGPFKV